jgi:hypothetical protein
MLLHVRTPLPASPVREEGAGGRLRGRLGSDEDGGGGWVEVGRRELSGGLGVAREGGGDPVPDGALGDAELVGDGGCMQTLAVQLEGALAERDCCGGGTSTVVDMGRLRWGLRLGIAYQRDRLSAPAFRHEGASRVARLDARATDVPRGAGCSPVGQNTGVWSSSARKTFTYKLMPTPEQEQTLATVVWRCGAAANATTRACRTAQPPGKRAASR